MPANSDFARAADACNVAQPTLSAAIRKLEDMLQVRLVVRGHRFVGLTPEGKRVCEWARQILKDYGSLRQELHGLRDGLTGTMQFGAIPAAMPVVSLLTAPLTQRHPGIAISLQSMTSRAIQRGLDAFELDAGLTYLDNEPLESVRRLPLYHERYLFVTSREGADPNRKTISWHDAAGEKLCLLSPDMQNRRIIDSLAASIGLTINPSVVSNSFLGVCSHLRSGGWASIVPHTFFFVFGAAPDLVAFDLVEPVHTQAVGLVVSAREPLPPLAKALIDSAAGLDIERELAAPLQAGLF